MNRLLFGYNLNHYSNNNHNQLKHNLEDPLLKRRSNSPSNRPSKQLIKLKNLNEFLLLNDIRHSTPAVLYRENK